MSQGLGSQKIIAKNKQAGFASIIPVPLQIKIARSQTLPMLSQYHYSLHPR